MRAPGTIQREIERQCAIGAGTCEIDTGHIGATGLLTVNACLDIATLEKVAASPALYDAADKMVAAYEAGDVNAGEIAINELRAALSLAREEAK